MENNSPTETSEQSTLDKINSSEELTQSINHFFQSLSSSSSFEELSNNLSAVFETDQKVKNRFNELVEETQQQELEDWDAVSRIKSHTSVIVYIYNGAYRTFKLTGSSWDTSEHDLEDYTIEPFQYSSFILRSEIPKRIGGKSTRSTKVDHDFTFASEHETFEFSTSLKINKPYDPFSFNPQEVPDRRHSAVVLNTSPIKVTSRISRQQSEKPYSYSVIISIS